MIARVPPSPATSMSFRKNESKLPRKSSSNGTCDSEYPTATHRIGMIRMQ